MNDSSIPKDFNLYEYAVIRVVPRVEREEFINIGLIMMCKRQKWLNSEIYINEKRILSLFPDADIKRIINQAKLFTLNSVPFPDIPVEESFRWLTAVKSAVIQTSPPHPGIAQGSLIDTFNTLFKELIL